MKYENMCNTDLVEAYWEAIEELDRQHETSIHHNMGLPYLSWYQKNRHYSSYPVKHDINRIKMVMYDKGINITKLKRPERVYRKPRKLSLHN